MCGIVGYVGEQSAIDVLVEGMKRVLYRGYDSAGICVLEDGKLEVIKHAGQPEVTMAEAEALRFTGTCGLAHTRWATHGEVTDANAHPHLSCRSMIAVVHNGQFWNYQLFRRELEEKGCVFATEVDSEVIAHLIERFRIQGDPFVRAVQKTAALLRGDAFAFAAVDASTPDCVVGACYGAPLYVGIADGGLHLASDHRGFCVYTKKVTSLKDGQVAVLRRGQPLQVTTFDNEEVQHDVEELWYELSDISRDPYSFHMEAEIHHQRTMLGPILEGRVTGDGRIRLGGIERNPSFQTFITSQLQRIVLAGCGTSYFACEVLEREAMRLGFDVRAVNAGELETMPFTFDPNTLFIPVSQSGTTAEVLDVAAKAEAAGAVIWPLVNVPASTLSRFGKGSGMYLQAGPETAVASTKAFTATLLNGGLLLHALALRRNQISALEVARFCEAARQLGGPLQSLLGRSNEFQDLGAQWFDAAFYQFLGKGYSLPIAEEGALKVKEITYYHTSGISASDLKHGTLATLDDDMLVVGICFEDPQFPKVYKWTYDNLAQVLSRQGKVIVVAAEGDATFDQMRIGENGVQAVIHVPTAPYGLLTSILAVVPLQLFALGMAKKLGRPIDRPRHIAKSSTVP